MDDRHRASATMQALGAAVIIAAAVVAIGGCTFEPPRAVLSLTVLETLDGDRFEPEPVRRAGLVPSPLLWLAEGDQVFVRWDQYRIVFPDEFAKWPECLLCTKTFQRCDADGDERWCFDCVSSAGSGPYRIGGRPTVKVMEWQLPIRDTADVLARLDHRAGCTDVHPDDPPAVTPTRDAALQLLAWLESMSPLAESPDLRGRPGHADLSVQIVRGRRVMDPRPLTLAPDGSLGWQVGGSAEQWEENFSDRLRVAEVRAVIYRPDSRPRSARTPTPLRAVTILGGPRCVAELDGHVTIAHCHTSPQPGAPTTAIDATPAYLIGQPRTRLTWVVEPEGIPVLEAGQALGIEFTLEVRP